MVLGTGITGGQYYWILGALLPFWYRSNPIESDYTDASYHSGLLLQHVCGLTVTAQLSVFLVVFSHDTLSVYGIARFLYFNNDMACNAVYVTMISCFVSNCTDVGF